MGHGRDDEAIAQDIDASITVAIFLTSILLGLGAGALYLSGYTPIAVILGVVAFLGANILTVGYSWWKRRARLKQGSDAPPVSSRSDDGAI